MQNKSLIGGLLLLATLWSGVIVSCPCDEQDKGTPVMPIPKDPTQDDTTSD